MSEFTPGIIPVVSSRWRSITAGGYNVISLQGPDFEGYYAATIRDNEGRMVGHSYLPDGTAIDAPEAFNLVSAHKPVYKVKYAQVILNSLGLPVVISASDKQFAAATTVMIFDNQTLVGSKAL